MLTKKVSVKDVVSLCVSNLKDKMFTAVLALGESPNKIKQFENEFYQYGFSFIQLDVPNDPLWFKKIIIKAQENPDKTIIVAIDNFEQISPENMIELVKFQTLKGFSDTSSGVFPAFDFVEITNPIAFIYSVNLATKVEDDFTDLRQKLNHIPFMVFNRMLTFEVAD